MDCWLVLAVQGWTKKMLEGEGRVRSPWRWATCCRRYLLFLFYSLYVGCWKQVFLEHFATRIFQETCLNSTFIWHGICTFWILNCSFDMVHAAFAGWNLSFSMVFAAFWNLNITVCMVFLSFLLPLRSLPPSFPSFHLQHFGPGTFRKAWYTWHFGAQTQNLGIEFPASPSFLPSLLPCLLACLPACLPACLLACLHLFSFLDPNDNWHTVSFLFFFDRFWSSFLFLDYSRLWVFPVWTHHIPTVLSTALSMAFPTPSQPRLMQMVTAPWKLNHQRTLSTFLADRY